MKEECMNLIKDVEEILERELTAELNNIKAADKFTPGQTDTLKEAVELMTKFKELEKDEYGNGMGMNAYAPRRNHYNGRYMSGDYYMNRSGHSTKDRMIARLEDMMGEAKNEYEARMISEAINHIATMG